MESHTARGSGYYDGLAEVCENHIAQGANAVALLKVVVGQRGHGNEFTEGGQRVGKLAREAGEVCRKGRVVTEVLDVGSAEIFGDEVVIAEAEDGIDALHGLVEGEAPLVGDIVGRDSCGADDQNQAVTGGDGVFNFFGESELARWHGHTVEPDLESGGRQSVIKATNEGFVIGPGVGEEDSHEHRWK